MGRVNYGKTWCESSKRRSRNLWSFKVCFCRFFFWLGGAHRSPPVSSMVTIGQHNVLWEVEINISLWDDFAMRNRGDVNFWRIIFFFIFFSLSSTTQHETTLPYWRKIGSDFFSANFCGILGTIFNHNSAFLEGVVANFFHMMRLPNVSHFVIFCQFWTITSIFQPNLGKISYNSKKISWLVLAHKMYFLNSVRCRKETAIS